MYKLGNDLQCKQMFMRVKIISIFHFGCRFEFEIICDLFRGVSKLVIILLLHRD